MPQSPRYSDYRHEAPHLGKNSIIINIWGDKTEFEPAVLAQAVMICPKRQS